MTNLGRIIAAVSLTIAMIAGCASAGAPSPTPSPTPVATVDSVAAALAAIARAEPRLATVGPLQPDLIGQASWYTVSAIVGGGFLLEFRVGWGDCPAGCIDEHTWTFRVGADGTVTLEAEAGSPLPPDVLPVPVGGSETGIDGVALAGPICPVQTVGDPTCDPRPVAGAAILIVDGTGAEVATTTTDAAGAFRVVIPAGVYRVIAQPVDGLMGTPGAQDAIVTAGASSHVQLDYDTGIR